MENTSTGHHQTLQRVNSEVESITMTKQKSFHALRQNILFQTQHTPPKLNRTSQMLLKTNVRDSSSFSKSPSQMLAKGLNRSQKFTPTKIPIQSANTNRKSDSESKAIKKLVQLSKKKHLTNFDAFQTNQGEGDNNILKVNDLFCGQNKPSSRIEELLSRKDNFVGPMNSSTKNTKKSKFSETNYGKTQSIQGSVNFSLINNIFSKMLDGYQDGDSKSEISQIQVSKKKKTSFAPGTPIVQGDSILQYFKQKCQQSRLLQSQKGQQTQLQKIKEQNMKNYRDVISIKEDYLRFKDQLMVELNEQKQKMEYIVSEVVKQCAQAIKKMENTHRKQRMDLLEQIKQSRKNSCQKNLLEVVIPLSENHQMKRSSMTFNFPSTGSIRNSAEDSHKSKEASGSFGALKQKRSDRLIETQQDFPDQNYLLLVTPPESPFRVRDTKCQSLLNVARSPSEKRFRRTSTSSNKSLRSRKSIQNLANQSSKRSQKNLQEKSESMYVKPIKKPQEKRQLNIQPTKAKNQYFNANSSESNFLKKSNSNFQKAKFANLFSILNQIKQSINETQLENSRIDNQLKNICHKKNRSMVAVKKKENKENINKTQNFIDRIKDERNRVNAPLKIKDQNQLPPIGFLSQNVVKRFKNKKMSYKDALDLIKQGKYNIKEQSDGELQVCESQRDDFRLDFKGVTLIDSEQLKQNRETSDRYFEADYVSPRFNFEFQFEEMSKRHNRKYTFGGQTKNTFDIIR